MNPKKITVSIQEFENKAGLPLADQQLIDAAFSAATNAYAPYSGFTVGAALRLSNNEIVTGNNQENAAYPSGLCAERVAIFYASSQFPELSIDTIAIVAKASGKDLSDPVTPCGSCRQVMAEYEQLHKKNMRIIMATESGKCFLVQGMANLLPLAFLAEQLKK